MKQTPTSLALVAGAALLYLPGCLTSQEPTNKPSIPAPHQGPAKWHGKTDTSEGIYYGDGFNGKWDGQTLTMPNGHKYVRRADYDNADMTLVLPNGQRFTEGGEKIDGNPPYVCEDESFVLTERINATKSGEIHIYLRGAGGKYKEVPGVQAKLGRLLGAQPAEEEWGVYRVRQMYGRTVTLSSIDYISGDEYKERKFKIKVATDGSVSLVR